MKSVPMFIVCVGLCIIGLKFIERAFPTPPDSTLAEVFGCSLLYLAGAVWREVVNKFKTDMEDFDVSDL